MTAVFCPRNFDTAPLSPTARIVSPEMATASAQGRVESPVQVRPKTMVSAGGAEWQAERTDKTDKTDKTDGADGADGADRMNVMDRVGFADDLGEVVQLLHRAAGGTALRLAEQVADVEQDLHHQLVSHVGGVELFHAPDQAFGLGPVVGLAIDGFEIGEDAVTGAHGARRYLAFSRPAPAPGVRCA